jgi:hypothetical protein
MTGVLPGAEHVSFTSGAGTAYPELTPIFSGVRVIRSLVLCVCFVDRCLTVCPFSWSTTVM